MQVSSEMAERVESAAWEDLFLTGARLGVAVRRLGATRTLLAPGFDHLLLNRTLGLERSVDVPHVLALHREARSTRFFVHCAREATDVAAALELEGLTRFPRSWVKLARGRGRLSGASTSLAVREARPDDDELVAGLFEHGFDLPPRAGALFAGARDRPNWTALVACEGDVPVAAGLAFRREGVGYLAGAATAPTHRRRGAQGALVRARIERLLDEGCACVTSETGEAVPGDPQHSYTNLVRFGLTPIGVRDNYTPPGATWTATAPAVWHARGSNDPEATPVRGPGA